MDKINFILYGGISFAVIVAVASAYYFVKKLRKHGETHKPQVMNKINDFYSTQDSSKPTINY